VTQEPVPGFAEVPLEVRDREALERCGDGRREGTDALVEESAAADPSH
jgi:hypothetical protein